MFNKWTAIIHNYVLLIFTTFLQQMGQICAIVQVFTPDTIGFLTAMPVSRFNGVNGGWVP